MWLLHLLLGMKTKIQNKKGRFANLPFVEIYRTLKGDSFLSGKVLLFSLFAEAFHSFVHGIVGFENGDELGDGQKALDLFGHV
jgi:hypothetical protein